MADATAETAPAKHKTASRAFPVVRVVPEWVTPARINRLLETQMDVGDSGEHNI